MRIVNGQSVASAVDLRPFDGWLIEDPVQGEFRQALHDEYPQDGFTTIHGDREDARSGYLGGRLELLRVDDPDGVPASSLSATWLEYIGELRSERYRRLIAEGTGVDVLGAVTRLRFSRYAPGAYIGRHYDGQIGKLLTQVLYFNLDWPSSWGGEFVMLSEDPADTEGRQRVAPTIGVSIVNLSTPAAAHRVNRISDDAREPRKTLLVEWYRAHGRDEG